VALDRRDQLIAELQAENAELNRLLAAVLERNAALERDVDRSSSNSRCSRSADTPTRQLSSAESGHKNKRLATSGFVAWLTGLPCAGKSTLARRLGERLTSVGVVSEILDGDAVRQHLSKGLGFSKEDRNTNVLRIGFVASLVARHGVPVIVAAVSPYRETRDLLRREVPAFVEIFVDCPIEVCEERDVKGMYAEARTGRRVGFTGIDDPYEIPLAPAVTVHTGIESVEESVDKILATLAERALLPVHRPEGASRLPTLTERDELERERAGSRLYTEE
jgi:adenylyl-sulfate kinase